MKLWCSPSRTDGCVMNSAIVRDLLTNALSTLSEKNSTLVYHGINIVTVDFSTFA